LLVADQPTDWQTAIANLLADEDLAMSLGLAARSFVERRHAWETTLTGLSELVWPIGQSPSCTADRSSIAATPHSFAVTAG
jgi:hypothetical protein